MCKRMSLTVHGAALYEVCGALVGEELALDVAHLSNPSHLQLHV